MRVKSDHFWGFGTSGNIWHPTRQNVCTSFSRLCQHITRKREYCGVRRIGVSLWQCKLMSKRHNLCRCMFKLQEIHLPVSLNKGIFAGFWARFLMSPQAALITAQCWAVMSTFATRLIPPLLRNACCVCSDSLCLERKFGNRNLGSNLLVSISKRPLYLLEVYTFEDRKNLSTEWSTYMLTCSLCVEGCRGGVQRLMQWTDGELDIGVVYPCHPP